MNVDETLQKCETMLDEYEKLSGISEFKPFDDSYVSKLFNMPIELLNKMTAMECAEAAYTLAQYSFYIQRLYNRESAKNKWANNRINRAVCTEIQDYNNSYMKYEQKIELIAKENEVVQKLINIINYSSLVMERLNFLSTSIKNMCETISNLQKAKSYQHKANNYEY